jgi:hypothetical protein
VPAVAESPAERIVRQSKALIGDLTRLAADAQTVDEARRFRLLAGEIERAALGAVGVALDRAEAICARH